MERALARLMISMAQVCVQAGAWAHRRRLAPFPTILWSLSASRWLACGASRLIRRRSGDDVRRLGEGTPLQGPPDRSDAPIGRWIVGSGLLLTSALALGATRVPAHGKAAAVALGVVGAAAVLCIVELVWAYVRGRGPALAPSAIALLVASLISLALLADGPPLTLLLGAINYSIAWRVLRRAIRTDRAHNRSLMNADRTR